MHDRGRERILGLITFLGREETLEDSKLLENGVVWVSLESCAVIADGIGLDSGAWFFPLISPSYVKLYI